MFKGQHHAYKLNSVTSSPSEESLVFDVKQVADAPRHLVSHLCWLRDKKEQDEIKRILRHLPSVRIAHQYQNHAGNDGSQSARLSRSAYGDPLTPPRAARRKEDAMDIELARVQQNLTQKNKRTEAKKSLHEEKEAWTAAQPLIAMGQAVKLPPRREKTATPRSSRAISSAGSGRSNSGRPGAPHSARGTRAATSMGTYEDFPMRASTPLPPRAATSMGIHGEASRTASHAGTPRVATPSNHYFHPQEDEEQQKQQQEHHEHYQQQHRQPTPRAATPRAATPRAATPRVAANTPPAITRDEMSRSQQPPLEQPFTTPPRAASPVERSATPIGDRPPSGSDINPPDHWFADSKPGLDLQSHGSRIGMAGRPLPDEEKKIDKDGLRELNERVLDKLAEVGIDPKGMAAGDILQMLYARKGGSSYKLMNEEAEKRLKIRASTPLVLKTVLNPQAVVEVRHARDMPAANVHECIDKWEIETLADACRTMVHADEFAAGPKSVYTINYGGRKYKEKIDRKKYVRPPTP
eukprot:TRINITY_DN5479_c0_g1_i1.p1 TRINITY_DN5479_c0_g1~~TRINITY_DN5479_c0_g1_i1.p1  ORF type:complete len:523 (-),score=82.59 TRINITY_DN5479_c0_g1_i1:205-1773(-)